MACPPLRGLPGRDAKLACRRFVGFPHFLSYISSDAEARLQRPIKDIAVRVGSLWAIANLCLWLPVQWNGVRTYGKHLPARNDWHNAVHSDLNPPTSSAAMPLRHRWCRCTRFGRWNLPGSACSGHLRHLVTTVLHSSFGFRFRIRKLALYPKALAP